MKVTEKDVVHVADLANLELSPDERSTMARDLSSILTYVERLSELDTASAEPMLQLEQSRHVGGKFADASREDVPEGLRKSLSQKTALENAPDADGTFFRVPKVIER